MADISLGSVYDYNKQLMDTFKNMSKDDIREKLNTECEALFKKDYLMLLCNDRRDFTIIKNTSKVQHDIVNELVEILVNRGQVLDITLQDDGAVEIWIKGIGYKDPENQVGQQLENFAYYLFDYTEGVVEV